MIAVTGVARQCRVRSGIDRRGQTSVVGDDHRAQRFTSCACRERSRAVRLAVVVELSARDRHHRRRLRDREDRVAFRCGALAVAGERCVDDVRAGRQICGGCDRRDAVGVRRRAADGASVDRNDHRLLRQRSPVRCERRTQMRGRAVDARRRGQCELGRRDGSRRRQQDDMEAAVDERSRGNLTCIVDLDCVVDRTD